MGIHRSANARRSALMGLLVLRTRGWIAIATVGLVLLLPVALTQAQDEEETLDEEARPRDRVVGQAGYAYQGKADIDGGGNLKVNRFDVGLLGRADLLERLRWTNTFFFSVNEYDLAQEGATVTGRQSVLGVVPVFERHRRQQIRLAETIREGTIENSTLIFNVEVRHGRERQVNFTLTVSDDSMVGTICAFTCGTVRLKRSNQ